MNILSNNTDLIQSVRGKQDILFISDFMPSDYLLIGRYGEVRCNDFVKMLNALKYTTFIGPFEFKTIIGITDIIKFRLENCDEDEVVYLFKQQKFIKYKNEDILPTFISTDDITKHKWELFR